MEKFVRLCNGLSYACGVFAAVLLMISLVLIIIEIVIRTLFSATLYITEEYSGYIMLAITFLGLSYTLKERGHIRMVFLHALLKGKARIVLDIFAFSAGLVICSLITITTANFFWDSVVLKSQSMQISGTYLAIPQLLMPLGSFMMALQFAAELVRSILHIRSGSPEEAEFESNALGH